jgi:hypothetical protein
LGSGDALPATMSQRQVELNRGLARCSLASDVLALVGASVGEFNVVNCGTALGRLARAPDGRRALGDARVASLLDAAASLVARHARHVESRQLASILHACGKLGLRVEHRASSSDASRGDLRDAPGGGGSASDPPSASAATRRLADAVESASRIHADKFNAQELANAAWGAARLGARLDRPLVRTLCDAIARSLADDDASASETTRGPRAAAAAWTPQGLSNAAWSLATMGAKLDALECANANANARAALVAVFAQLARRARELNPQEVANAAWAVAKTCEEEDEDEVEVEDDEDGRDGDDRDRSRERGGTGFEPSREGASLRDAARRAARALLGASGPVTPGWHASRGFEPRHAANAAWASAKVGKTLGVEALFPPAMHRALRDAAGRMNAQELAMALWALAETETAEEHRSVGASEETNSNATRDEEAEEETAAAGISSASAARRSRSSLGASTLDALASAFARAASSATPRQLATGLRALAASGLTLSVADAKALAEAVAATFGKDVPLSAESPRGGGTTTTTRVVPHEARDLANAFWALAKLEWRAETAAFDALSAAARRRVRASRRARRRERTGADEFASSNDSRVGNSSSFAPRELATIVWSHGMLGRGDDARLLDACAKEARATLGDFAGRDLSDFAHGLNALGVDASSKPNLLRRVAKAARENLRRGTFNAQALLKFLGAFGRMGAEDAKLAAALRERRRVELRFPALARAEASAAAKPIEADDRIDLGAGGGAATSADDRIARVSLISATPESFRADARKNEARVDDSCGGFGRGNTGVALWEGAFVLAEWVSRRGGRCSAGPSSGWGPGGGWRGKVVVELGAGLGLPSIVASRLGAEVIATDGTRASFWVPRGFLGSVIRVSRSLRLKRSFGFGVFVGASVLVFSPRRNPERLC